MSPAPQSPLYTIISLSLIVSGLVVVGLVSGLIARVIPGMSGAGEAAIQVEAKAEAARAMEVVVGNPAGMAIASSGAADQAGKSSAALPVPVAEDGPKKP